MLTRAGSALILAVLTGTYPLGRTEDRLGSPATLTVHEWGTFTTVAGPTGLATDWLPLGGPTDLPCFVEHFQDRRNVKIAPNQPLPVDYATARSSLWGKVRMETPVLYFYAPRATTVSVRVTFPRGLMTEWYPRASVAQRFVDPNAVRNPRWASTITWPNVNITPGASPSFPSGEGPSHYYAARNTEASPLTVDGQHERFLFYRGVASFDVPLSVAVLGDGRVRLRNLGSDALTGVVLFQNHHGAISYRLLGNVQRDTTVETPNTGGSVADLRRELERSLVTAGLYPKEATAMVDSWRDSWFEEGTRVFYLVPPRAIDAILPLTVTPAPATTTRVFVGRMELITRETQASVEKAIMNADSVELQRYGRFLEPITDRILATNPTTAERQRIGVTTTAVFASFVKRASTCE